jgi:O-antigen/teichoic acid export membrane protein
MSYLEQMREAAGRFDALLIRGGFAVGLIKLGGTAFSFLLTVYLARILVVDQFGTYSFLFALASIASVPILLGLPTLVTREIAAYHANDKWGPIRGVIRFSIIYIAGSSAILIALSTCVILIFLDGGTLKKYVLAFAAIPLLALLNLITAALMGLQNVRTAHLLSSIVLPIMQLCIAATLFSVFPSLRSYPGAMYSYIFAAGVTLSISILVFRGKVSPVGRVSKFEYEVNRWWRSMTYLGIASAAGVINSYTDLVMLGWMTTDDAVGIYRIAVQGGALVVFGLGVTNAVAAPRFAALYSRGESSALQRLVCDCTSIGFSAALLVSLVFFLFGSSFINIVFGESYIQALWSLLILTAGHLTSAGAGPVGYLLNMTGNESDAARGLVISASVNVFLNILLIPSFGIFGAAIATSISLVIWNLLLRNYVHTRLGIRSDVLTAHRK